MPHLVSTAVLQTEQMAAAIRQRSVSAPRTHGYDAGAMERRVQEEHLQTSSSSGRCSDKDVMRGLNDRLAGFIEKVRQLERHNHLLEREIEEIRGSAKPASRLEEQYGPELSELRRLVQDVAGQKLRVELEQQCLEEDLLDLRRQHEQEARSRSGAESSVALLRKDISDACQAKLQLEKQAQALVDEILLLKRNHEAEVSEMFDRSRDAQETLGGPHGFGSRGITAALRDIRRQLGGHAVTDLQQVGDSFRSQFARLTEAAETKREALKATQREIQEHRRRLQARTIELDCARGTREALEKQLHDAEDRHKEEMIHYQNTIKELENELINCKFDMSGYLREYQDLLNVKMALDVEILSYRKLLCGEEARLSAGSDSHMSLPYIYHQSPVYTLPSFSRPGGPRRRVEPQYKFVEEIITETTREIELSEFEEGGSEEAGVGMDERELAKRDGGGGEEAKDNKDSREGEGEQMCDSQQNQVGGGSQEVQKDLKGKDEAEKTKAADSEGDGGIDNNTESKVLLSKSLDEKENEQYQKDLSSKRDAAVDEPDKSVSAKKGDAEKDNFISATAMKPVDEVPAQVSTELDKAQELGSAVGVQDEVHAPGTVEKPTDFTAEAGSSLCVETEKAQVTSAPAAKDEEKEHEFTQLKASRRSEDARGDERVAISTQDARVDSHKSPAKETSLKSNEERVSEVEDQTPHSAGKTDTPVTQESSQVQKPGLTEGSEKAVNDPQEKAKVESSK